MKPRSDLTDQLLDLAWRQWTTLGVAGTKEFGPIAIDLEALILLSARLSAKDPRLRDEALDWCTSSHRYISKPRLKQLLRLASSRAQDAFALFATALERHVGGSWPGARAELGKLKLSGKSRTPNLSQSSLVNLRLRALLGVGARADVVTAALNWPAPDFGAADLVFVGYTKRNLADALDTLADGGLFHRARVGNRLRFAWRKHDELIGLIGPMPKTIPRWPVVARILIGYFDLLERTEGKSDRIAVVEAVREFDKHRADLTQLGLEPPRAVTAPLTWSPIVAWMLANARELTEGRPGVAFEAG